ncbi:MAG: S41 family peptidase [Solirubrobacterales bacterium]|nr:S41 family peptidase [Solirubrobacterales bacterium]
MKTATVAVWAVIAGMLLGMWAGGHPDNLPSSLREIFVADDGQTQSVSDQAAGLIRDKYFRVTDPDQVQDSSIDGMVRKLRRQYHDRFSHYFNPEQNAQLSESLEGSFSGVGMTVGGNSDAGLEVGFVFRGSPAADAGLKAGDLIVSVDGESIRGEDVDLIVAKIKGPEGTDVTLGIKKGGKGEAKDFKLTREQIRVPITANRIREVDGRKLGYVQLTTFSQGAGVALKRATERVIDKGAEGVVLDLRENGGGLLPEAILTSSVFLDQGDVVVETRSRTEGNETYRALGGNIDAPPVVVLVNRNTASAAEILAAALQADMDAPVVGTRTFGKGVFQQVLDLENGGSLDLTVGEFFTAKGVSLAGKGLKPDVYAPLPKNATRDVQLNKAFDVLSGEVASGGSSETGE